MTSQSTPRQEAAARLQRGHDAVDSLLARLSEAEMTRPATIGGGEWSTKDLLGHLAFWEELALHTVAEWRSGERLRVADIFAAGNAGTEAANATNQERTAGQSPAEVRERAAAARRALLATIEAMSDEEWQATGGAAARPDLSLGELVGGVLASDQAFAHAWAHLPDLEAYVASLRGDGGPGIVPPYGIPR